jgi:predicted transposase/invertase (TIGR01784 family)
LYTKLSKQELEHNTLMDNAKKRGLKEGIEQGIKQRNIEIAKNMLKKKIDIDTISECTGLSKKEIEKLK